MRLQYQLSNGMWADVGESRVAEFVALCAQFRNITEDAVRSALAAGREVYFDSDWYTRCRDGDVGKRAATDRDDYVAGRVPGYAPSGYMWAEDRNY